MYHLDKIVDRTRIYITQLFQEGHIKDEMIADYTEMTKENLHSWLQYAVICSGEDFGLKRILSQLVDL